jgi:hypothetical protein
VAVACQAPCQAADRAVGWSCLAEEEGAPRESAPAACRYESLAFASLAQPSSVDERAQPQTPNSIMIFPFG